MSGRGISVFTYMYNHLLVCAFGYKKVASCCISVDHNFRFILMGMF